MGLTGEKRPLPAQDRDEVFLRRAGLELKPDSLRLLLRHRDPTPAEHARLTRLVQRLGDDSFKRREQAQADLVAAGLPALPALHAAVADKDPERARRARECLAALEWRAAPAVVEAAARWLTEHRAAGAVETLLIYLPRAEADGTADVIRYCLGELTPPDRAPDPALKAALTSTVPAVRATAAALLGRRAEAGLRRAVGRLLLDPSAEVRLSAAEALLHAGEREAVPVLLALLADAPLPLAWRAEGLLIRLAGREAPPVALQGKAATRRLCRAAWVRWWKSQKPAFAIAARLRHNPTPRVVLVTTLLPGKYPTQLIGLGKDFRNCWKLCLRNDEYTVMRMLPSGRFLLSESSVRREQRQVSELDRAGKVVWKVTTKEYPLDGWRLSNGNTMLVLGTGMEEVTPEGKTVWSYNPELPICSAQPLPNGRIAFTYDADIDQGLMILSRAERKMHRVSLDGFPPGLDGARKVFPHVKILSNGHLLLAHYNEVAEASYNGKIVWKWTLAVPDELVQAIRLPNGHTLITTSKSEMVEVIRNGKTAHESRDQGRLLEVDRRGKVVREYKFKGRPGSLQILP